MHEDDHFNELLRRYLQGECKPEEEKLVRSWYESLGEGRGSLQLNPKETLELQDRLWRNIRKGSGGVPLRRNRSKPWMKWLLYSSASAAVLLLLVIFLFQQETFVDEQVAASTAVYQKTNNSTKTILVVLQDESMVWLKPSGSIHYENFSSSPRRKVTLDGEAFFEVTENKEKPFLVYTGNVVTRVTGTKFNVKAYKTDKTVEVEVTEGSVEVHGEREEAVHNLTLTARQKAVYHTGSRKLEKLTGIRSQLEPVTNLSRDLAFEFNDTPLRKVIDLLEAAYPVSIELDNERLENCPLTASLNDETLDIKLELICRSIGATFSKSPGKVMISGPGCYTE